MPTKRILRALILGGTLATMLATGIPAAQADPGVEPASFSASLNPGASANVTKTVHTSPVPPNPDIVLLSDTTGSMGSAINNVKANATSVINSVRSAQPTSLFGVAEFKDREHSQECGVDPFDVRLDQALTSVDADVVNGINQWNANGGCDVPENWLLALDFLATDPSVGFRTGSTRIVVLFGDAIAHDDGTPSLASTIADLQAAGIRVVLVNVGNLDGAGQAGAIAGATGGVLLNGTQSDVSSAILAGIQAIPVTVAPTPNCDPKLTATFDAASKTVTSGDDAVFSEALTLAADAPQGSTLTCTVKFLVDGKDEAGFTQTATIKVNDVTPPIAACKQTTNPAGKNVPTAGPGAGASGQNPDGFYLVSATDNVDPSLVVVVRDAGSGTVFGPFPSRTTIKYTQARGATPGATAMGGNVIHIKGTGDAQVSATDAAGNVSPRVSCLVPPFPK